MLILHYFHTSLIQTDLMPGSFAQADTEPAGAALQRGCSADCITRAVPPRPCSWEPSWWQASTRGAWENVFVLHGSGTVTGRPMSLSWCHPRGQQGPAQLSLLPSAWGEDPAGEKVALMAAGGVKSNLILVADLWFKEKLKLVVH